MFQTGAVEKVRTYILCSVTFLFFIFENRAFHEMLWKCIVQSDRPQVTLWRMRFAYWTPKTTNTHPVCVIRLSFPLQQWLLERASILRYTCTARLVLRPFLSCLKGQSISNGYYHKFSDHLISSDFYLSCPWPSVA
jgi:hypothetical protein